MSDIVCACMAAVLERGIFRLKQPKTAKKALEAGWTEGEYGWLCPVCMALEVKQGAVDTAEQASGVQRGVQEGEQLC